MADDGEYTLDTGPTLKVGELIDKLKLQDPEKKIVIFAAGDDYPCCQVQDLENLGNDDFVELGAGWRPIDIGIC